MPSIYPVIHHLNKDLTLEQADIAFNAGADGVFLISHFRENEVLLPIARAIKHKHPHHKIGVNLLGHDIMDTINMAMEFFIDMVWFDNCGVSSRGLTEVGQQLADWKKANLECEFDIFASVAFKYQPADHNPNVAAEIALANGFIPTTSGTATGSAPQLDKIKGMNLAAGGTLAVASGMTLANVELFVPYLSHILVSTGVCTDEHHFNPLVIKEFISAAKQNNC